MLVTMVTTSRLTNSTVSGNTSGRWGWRDLVTGLDSPATLTNSTISGNSARASGGGIFLLVMPHPPYAYVTARSRAIPLLMVLVAVYLTGYGI